MRKAAVIVVAACGGLSLAVFATKAIREWVSKAPFQMVIEPSGDRAVVQFTRPDFGLISKSFPIELHLEKRQQITLDSPATTVPGGRIEFADTTILPGHFRIRVGESLFDIMVRGIEVNGQQFEWLHDDSLQ
jgi:hypothetical protein